MRKLPSLNQKLKLISLRWAVVAFILSAGISFGFVSYLSKMTEELRLQTLARSVTRAYRPTILDGMIRNAQAQMKNSLSLGSEETVLVRGKSFETLYSPDGEEHAPSCKKGESVCWNGSKMTYLQPIFFNDGERDSLFGYVELTIQSNSQYKAGLVFVGLLGLSFLVLIFGILSSAGRITGLVDETLRKWSEALKFALIGDRREIKVPYREFSELGGLIGSLHTEVEGLRASAAADAHLKGQVSVLRGIGHDLKTPFSQLRKFFEVLKLNYQRTGVLDAEVSDEIRRSTDRLALLLKEIGQATRAEVAPDAGDSIVDLGEEVADYLGALKKDPDFNARSILVNAHAPVGSYFAGASKVQFYRIFDNLMKNALDAVDDAGTISVTVGNFGGRPSLIIEDNGDGILSENLTRIFDADFTTKASRGTGLGLSIVRKICGEAGADVSVQSVLKQGASFCVRFRNVDGQTGVLAHGEDFIREVNL